MALLLSQASSYNSGNDLWIIADEKSTNWFNRLDWYLNFNLAAYKLHQSKKLSPWLLKVVKQCELELPEIMSVSDNTPLLISTEKWIPARWIAVHPLEGENKEKWVDSIHNTWIQLNKPSLRVFLPNAMTTTQFTSAWGKLDPFSDYTLVTD